MLCMAGFDSWRSRKRYVFATKMYIFCTFWVVNVRVVVELYVLYIHSMLKLQIFFIANTTITNLLKGINYVCTKL